MKRTIGLMLLALSVTAPSVAYGQQVCLPHEDAVTKLNKDYGEQATAVGLGSEGQTVFELFVGEAGSWTLLATKTNGFSCIAAAGESWNTLPVVVAGNPT